MLSIFVVPEALPSYTILQGYVAMKSAILTVYLVLPRAIAQCSRSHESHRRYCNELTPKPLRCRAQCCRLAHTAGPYADTWTTWLSRHVGLASAEWQTLLRPCSGDVIFNCHHEIFIRPKKALGSCQCDACNVASIHSEAILFFFFRGIRYVDKMLHFLALAYAKQLNLLCLSPPQRAPLKSRQPSSQQQPQQSQSMQQQQAAQLQQQQQQQQQQPQYRRSVSQKRTGRYYNSSTWLISPQIKKKLHQGIYAELCYVI